MLYGSTEFAHAEPFANSLAGDRDFCSWVVRQTRFSAFANSARLLKDEMQAARSGRSSTWWRSHFTEKCRCPGCKGQETDILAIFEVQAGQRFALHFEVKQPGDRFPIKKDQAGNYAVRAACWVRSGPAAILPHNDADTVLVCSNTKLMKYAPHIPKFGAVITFEQVAKCFPQAVVSTSGVDD